MPNPHFKIKNKFQKKTELYENILTGDILSDVCERITGKRDYTVEFDNTGYNIGRLATLEYQGTISYISFSGIEIRSRNASFQSFPSALVRYHKESNTKKSIYFYFLPSTGNIETPYFIFMYRLMKTAGTIFLNEIEQLNSLILPFNSIEDIIRQRNLNTERNRANKPTYLTTNQDNTLQIYGKTYGANKYETTLLCLAISKITTQKIELYQIREGSLKILPAPVREVIQELGKIEIIDSDLTLEREEFEKSDSLRSPAFIYNLLEKLGNKKCVLCECKIPQLIQGAHIWPVVNIKKTNNINQERKLESAIDGDNGIWLCNNHHKLFDINMILMNNDGRIKYKSNIRENYKKYICNVTANHQIRREVLTPKFLQYLQNRNSGFDERIYNFIEPL